MQATNSSISFFVSIPIQITKEDIAKLVEGFDNPGSLASGGVTLAGQRYIYLSGNERIIRAKLGRNGVHCMKTVQGMWMIPIRKLSSIHAISLMLNVQDTKLHFRFFSSSSIFQPHSCHSYNL